MVPCSFLPRGHAHNDHTLVLPSEKFHCLSIFLQSQWDHVFITWTFEGPLKSKLQQWVCFCIYLKLQSLHLPSYLLRPKLIDKYGERINILLYLCHFLQCVLLSCYYTWRLEYRLKHYLQVLLPEAIKVGEVLISSSVMLSPLNIKSLSL